MSIRIRIYPQQGLGFAPSFVPNVSYAPGLGTSSIDRAIVRARRQRQQLARQQALLARQQAFVARQQLQIATAPSFGYGAGFTLPGAFPSAFVPSVPAAIVGRPFGGFLSPASSFGAPWSPFGGIGATAFGC